jgi:carbohydrate diacid regulator
MLTGHVLQSAVNGLQNITGRDIAVLEHEGNLAAGTGDLVIGHSHNIDNFIHSSAESQLLQGNRYFKILENGAVAYVVVIRGEDEDALDIGRLTVFHIQSLAAAYKERLDRDNFIKSLLLDNLLLVDIYSRAKKLHVENNVRRVVYLIETEIDKDHAAVEIVRSIFPAKQRDFVTAVDERNIILVKELKEKEDKNSIEQYARDICDTLGSEAMSKVFVAIGTVVTDLKNVSSSYIEARTARDIGRIFEADKQIVNYGELGIGRLIFHLPVPLCTMFINETLHGQPISGFDEETLNTVQKFFENDLNVSETSRELYVHRNTLVYRLDKLQKQTGLDLRKFEDAITFKIAMMVHRYMKHGERR